MTREENIRNTEKENEIVIADYFRLVKSNWYWFVISVIVCCTVAGFYLITTPNIYKRTAQIMIKDDVKHGSSGLDEMSVLNDLNLFSSQANVNNEVELLRSKRLMYEVINRLSLDVSYKINSLNGLRTENLYTSSPIAVKFIDVEKNSAYHFKLDIISTDKVKIYNFKKDNEDLEISPIDVKIMDTVVTPIGKIIVSPTLYFSADFSDRISVSKHTLKGTVESIIRRLTVDVNKNNTVITLSITDDSRNRADDILNTLISVYDKDNITYKNQVVVSTSNFINERLAIIETELTSVDKNISQYKSEHMVTDLQASTGIFLSESSAYNKQVFELQNQLAIAGFIKEYLAAPINNNNLIPANSGIENRALESEISEYNSIMLKRNQLIESGSEKSPAVVECTNILVAMKQSIIRSVDNLILGLQLQIEGVKNRELQANKKIANVPENQREIAEIDRKQKIQENLYLYLLQKREENELAGAITTSNYRIIDVADGDLKPVSPKTSIILLVALILGLIIPFAIFWLREVTNNRVRNTKDITDNLTVPFLGVIPLVSKKKRYKVRKSDIVNSKIDKTTIVVKDSSRGAASEAFRIIRTNMDFINVKEEGAKVVMFTSFNVGSGKSFSSINMSMSFALINKKSILLDLDLRKANTSKYVDSPKEGLSGYLSGRIDNYKDIIVKGTLHPNLDVLPVGIIPPNPAELLLGSNLNKLIAELRKDYDYVFIDTTPVDIVADAYIVGKVADMTLFLIRQGLMDRRLLPELENIYKSGRLNNLAVILNGVTEQGSGYGYRYGYGYGYGYGYVYK